MKNWFKYIVAPAVIIASVALVGCGDKNKQTSIPGFNPFGPGYPNGVPVSSVTWTGRLGRSNGKDNFRKFLRDIGVCASASTTCRMFDGGSPSVTLYLDPTLIQPGSGAWGQVQVQTSGGGYLGHQTRSFQLSGQFRLVSGNSFYRAEGIYGGVGQRNYNKETTIDLTGDPNSGRMQMTIYYRGKNPANAILNGTVYLRGGAPNGNGFNNNPWGYNPPFNGWWR